MVINGSNINIGVKRKEFVLLFEILLITILNRTKRVP
jgi:hypothetical protein